MTKSSPYEPSSLVDSDRKDSTSVYMPHLLLLDCLNLAIWTLLVVAGSVVGHKINTAVDANRNIEVLDVFIVAIYCLPMIFGLISNILVIRGNCRGLTFFYIRLALSILFCGQCILSAILLGASFGELTLLALAISACLWYYRAIYNILVRKIAV